MNASSKARWLAIALSLLLAACAAPQRAASDKSAGADKNVRSKVCRGKIDKNREDGAGRKLAALVDDPTTFFCNVSYQMTLVIRDQAKALGRAEQELAATRALEALENGTYGPKSVAMVANYKLSDEQKAEEIRMLQDAKYLERKMALQDADSRMKYVYQDFALGMGSVLVQIKKAQMANDAAKRSKEKSDDFLAALVTIKATADIINVASMGPGIADAFGQWQDNKAHLKSMLSTDGIDPKSLKVTPD